MIVRESLGEIFKSKEFSDEVLLENLSDLRSNREKIMKLFNGKIPSKFMTISAEYGPFISKHIDELSESLTNMYFLCKKLGLDDNPITNDWLEKKYYGSTGYITAIKVLENEAYSFSYRNKKFAESLNSGFWEIVYELLKKFNVKMMDPSPGYNYSLYCSLSRELTEQETDELKKAVHSEGPRTGYTIPQGYRTLNFISQEKYVS